MLAERRVRCPHTVLATRPPCATAHLAARPRHMLLSQIAQHKAMMDQLQQRLQDLDEELRSSEGRAQALEAQLQGSQVRRPRAASGAPAVRSALPPLVFSHKTKQTVKAEVVSLLRSWHLPACCISVRPCACKAAHTTWALAGWAAHASRLAGHAAVTVSQPECRCCDQWTRGSDSVTVREATLQPTASPKAAQNVSGGSEENGSGALS